MAVPYRFLPGLVLRLEVLGRFDSSGLATAPGSVATEGPGRSELAQLVPDHFFGHVDADMSPSVVHEKSVTDELRRNRTPPRPGPDRLLAVFDVEMLDFLEQLFVNEGAFLE